MNKSVKQIILIFIILLTIIGFSATIFAGKTRSKSIVVNFPDGTQINLSSKKEYSLEVLEDNNIILLDNEIVENEKINDDNSINIKSLESVMKVEKQSPVLKSSKIEKQYENIVEKIEIEEIKIPYETIERVAEGYNSQNGRSVIVQKGEEGLKQIKYRATYTNNTLNQRTKLSEEVIKNPTNQIIQKSINRTPVVAVRIPEGDSKTAFEQIVSEKGISELDKNRWARLIQRESSWNATNVNRSSGAYGLPQALPGHKMASHGADWKTNPKTQLRWMYDYMVGRYGSISNALSHSDRNGWY